MSGATPQDSGLASGLVNTSVQVGGALGLAVLATLATERTDGLLAEGHSTPAAPNADYHLAYLIHWAVSAATASGNSRTPTRSSSSPFLPRSGAAPRGVGTKGVYRSDA
jgi:hypothetical protein